MSSSSSSSSSSRVPMMVLSLNVDRKEDRTDVFPLSIKDELLASFEKNGVGTDRFCRLLCVPAEE